MGLEGPNGQLVILTKRDRPQWIGIKDSQVKTVNKQWKAFKEELVQVQLYRLDIPIKGKGRASKTRAPWVMKMEIKMKPKKAGDKCRVHKRTKTNTKSTGQN